MQELNPTRSPILINYKLIHIDDYDKFRTFNCGNSQINDFLLQQAYVAHISREASTTLIINNGDIIGFYTLSKSTITTIDEDDQEIKLPCLSIERLAIDEAYQKRGIGGKVLNQIIEIAYTSNERFISLDAIYPKWEWYYNRGFELYEEEMNEDPTSLVYMIMDLYDERLIEDYAG